MAWVQHRDAVVDILRDMRCLGHLVLGMGMAHQDFRIWRLKDVRTGYGETAG